MSQAKEPHHQAHAISPVIWSCSTSSTDNSGEGCFVECPVTCSSLVCVWVMLLEGDLHNFLSLRFLIELYGGVCIFVSL